MRQVTFVSSSNQPEKTTPAGTRSQPRTRLESYHARAGWISMVNTLRRRVQPFVSVAPSVVTLAVCCTLSAVASQRPRRHRPEGAAYGQPLRGPDGPGARHHVGVPHLGDQPHPLLQLPRRGHDGERRAVRPEDAAARGRGNSYVNRRPRWRACHHSSMLSHTTSRKIKKPDCEVLVRHQGGGATSSFIFYLRLLLIVGFVQT